MAIVTQNKAYLLKPKRAHEFADGEVVIDPLGLVGIVSGDYIIRRSVSGDNIFAMNTRDSTDSFTKAPSGTSFTVTAL